MQRFTIKTTAFSEALAAFIEHMRQQGFKAGTIRIAKQCLAEFLAYLESILNVYDLRRIEPAHIARHYHRLEARPCYDRPGGLSSSMLRNHLYSLKLFFSWLVKSESLEVNPFAGVDFRPEHVPFRLAISEADVLLLFEAAQTFREKALLSLAYCGLRRGEISRLNWMDIDWKESFLVVKRGKNNKRREVPIPPKAAGYLHTYFFEERPGLLTALRNGPAPAFLLTLHGKRLSGHGAAVLFKSVWARTSLPKDVSLHTLRHSFATHLKQRGCPIEVIQELLGHQELDTTLHYLRYQELHAAHLNH